MAKWLDTYGDGGNLPTKEQIASDPELKYWDKYNTKLTPTEQKEFDKWVKSSGSNPWDKGSYDVQGYWKSGAWKNNVDPNGHGTDTYKKPNHPTFSNESIYHGIDGLYGGNWTKESGYQPSKQTLSLYGPDYYKWMFGTEPNRPEHLDMSRYSLTIPYTIPNNSPTPLVYANGGWLDQL